jgi:hypothetical protein
MVFSRLKKKQKLLLKPVPNVWHAKVTTISLSHGGFSRLKKNQKLLLKPIPNVWHATVTTITHPHTKKK